MLEISGIMLRSGGPMFPLLKQVQIRLEQDFVEDHPNDEKQDDLINDADIEVNHSSIRF
jgi:hypothetical protein